MVKIPQNENKSACALCQGKCCNNMPGSFFPEQLKEITVDAILQKLKEGYAIDWWEGDPRNNVEKKDRLMVARYLRPAIVGHEHKVFHPAWGGRCSFLLDTGCKLEFKDRPAECQDLKPNKKSPGSGCKGSGKYTKHKAAIAWAPYQKLLLEAVIKYNDEKTISQGQASPALNIP